jgi:hypothetical protein
LEGVPRHPWHPHWIRHCSSLPSPMLSCRPLLYSILDFLNVGIISLLNQNRSTEDCSEMAAAMFQGRSSLRWSRLMLHDEWRFPRLQHPLPDSGGGGARSAACLRLVLVSIVVGRWSRDLFVIFFTFEVLCTTLNIFGEILLRGSHPILLED